MATFAAVFGGDFLAGALGTGALATGFDGAFVGAFVAAFGGASAAGFLVAGGGAFLVEVALVTFAAVFVTFFALLVAGPERPPDRDAAAIATPLCTAIALLSSGRKEPVAEERFFGPLLLCGCQAS